MTFRFSFNAFYFTRPIPFTDSLISANRKRALKSVDKYIRCMDSQARYARLLGGENVGERGGRGDNLRRSEDTVGNRVFSQRLFPPARENKREKWGGGGRVNVRHAGSRCRGLLIHLVPPTMRCRFIPPSTVFAAWPSRDSRFTV